MPKKSKSLMSEPAAPPPVYLATAPFDLLEGGETVTYAAGEEFTPPAEWSVVANHPTLAHKPGVIFSFTVQVAERRTPDGRRTPVMDARTVCLPVRPLG